MNRRSALAFFLLLCTFALAACGGGGDDDVDVDKVLAETFGDAKDINSGRLDVSLRLDANGIASLQGPVSLRLSGPFATTKQDELPRFALEAELTAGGQTFKAGATSTGDKGFVSFQGQAYALSDELYQQFKKGYAEEARKSEEEGGGTTFEALGIDPRRWLRDPSYEGREDVGGAETLHIRAGIDVPRLLEDVNRVLARAEDIPQGQQRARQLTEEERRQISDAIKDARLELWTGEKDKIMRRLNVRLEFEVPEASREQAQGLSSGTIRFDLGFGAINTEQQIKGPEDARPFEELLAQLQGG
ncbi:MAG: hypothetical protein M3389_06300, partial [Actinomycetota bacterium]|nr:hypothetical protein [Actinomycetota bacterium]